MSATGSRKAVCDVQHNTSRTDKGDLPISPDLTDDIGRRSGRTTYQAYTIISVFPEPC